MNYQQTLLVRLMEEANELAQATSKALLFGLDHCNPETKVSNGDKINDEYNDLLGTIDELKTTGFVLASDVGLRLRKQHKIRRYSEISRELGVLKPTLTPNEVHKLVNLRNEFLPDNSMRTILNKVLGRYEHDKTNRITD